MQVEIVPAILVKSNEELLQRIKVVKPYVKTIQIDVMDGKFVPNKTITGFSDLPKGVQYEFHWMVENPQFYIKNVIGNHLHIVHIETVTDWKEIQKTVEKSGGKLAVAINPETRLEKIIPYINKVSMVLIMTVNPGFSNQKYLSEMESKIKKLRSLYPKIDIEVDGGINQHTIAGAAKSGANKFGAASAIYGSDNIKEAITHLMDVAKSSYKGGHNERGQSI